MEVCSDPGDDINNYVYTVDVLYGPTNVAGVVKHRTGRVERIKEKLEQLGFAVFLRRISDYGMVAFAFEGQIIFSCAAKNLSFADSWSRYPLANTVIQKMVNERNYADILY
ncbi:Uncharacterised protein family UPF0728 [Cinara cedri]|uniref:Uncharacterized protein n=1 Tax=Cinara cedri TaxID=506608 RepID=A0A5E4N2A7_9HEMI|nr:Uncharacterised protein family UPF0728 [Cinara cedri]